MKQWGSHAVALLLVLSAHVLLLAFIVSLRPQILRPLHQSLAGVVDAYLIHLPPEPAPTPEPALPPQQAPVATERTRPLPPASAAAAAADPGPPVHDFASDADWGKNERDHSAISVQGARRVPSDYADKVKARVLANLVRPGAATYQAPRGYQGDPKELQRQCTIPYEITVDREGRMISFEIDPCGDKLLDAAAEAALKNAGPFPPPPNLGADTYVVHGSANFRVK